MKTTITVTGMLIVCSNALAGIYGDPPDKKHPYAVHDYNRPQPKVITPGSASTQDKPGKAPSDAVVLFNGKSVDAWEANNGKPTKWVVKDGTLISVKGAGYIKTKRSFGDCQLHVEWAAPTPVKGSGQGRGNSGVFLMGIYEIQVLDCYKNQTYPDGQTASAYGQHPPLVNACRPTGQWQSYDIVFRTPRFKDGKLSTPGSITVLHNGVLVQDHWILEGPTCHKRRTNNNRAHAERGPLKLQDHGNPVRYRNIWIRELEPKGKNGTEPPNMQPGAVAALRKKLSLAMLEKAKTEQGMVKLGRFLESIQYEPNKEAMDGVLPLSRQFLNSFKGDAGKIDKAKRSIIGLRNAYRMLVQHNLLPDDFPALVEIDAFIAQYSLEKKKKH